MLQRKGSTYHQNCFCSQKKKIAIAKNRTNMQRNKNSNLQWRWCELWCRGSVRRELGVEPTYRGGLWERNQDERWNEILIPTNKCTKRKKGQEREERAREKIFLNCTYFVHCLVITGVYIYSIRWCCNWILRIYISLRKCFFWKLNHTDNMWTRKVLVHESYKGHHLSLGSHVEGLNIMTESTLVNS